MTNRLRSALLAATALAVCAAPALAVGPSQTTLQVYPQYNTYTAVTPALTPAASATDFFTLTGSATTTVYVKQIGCTGVSTAAASQIVTAIVRSTANSAGTAVNLVEVSMDSSNPTATAAAQSYTANPTLGTSVGALDTGLLQTLAPASTGTAGLFFNFSDISSTQPIVLRGATQVLSLNAGGVSFAAGTSLTCKVTWSER